MLEGHRRARAERVPISPLKKVTFYGPVTNAKGERLRQVGIKPVPPNRPVFSSSYLLDQRCGVNSTVPLNEMQLHSKSNEERPHSKTPVLGKQIKTRLNCNHTKPRCEACIADRKRSSEVKHRSLIADAPRQSHILASTRSHPRGGTNGRKLYDPDDRTKSAYVVDSTWKPGQDMYSKRPEDVCGDNIALNGENTLGSRHRDENALGSRQGNENALGSRHRDENPLGSRYDDENALGSRHRNENTLGSRHRDENILGSKHGEENALGSRHRNENALGSRHEDVNVIRSRHKDENAFRSRHRSENASGSRLGEENLLGSRHRGENALGSRHGDENALGNRHGDENALGSRQSSEEGIRKKVQFADRVNGKEKLDLPNLPSGSSGGDYVPGENSQRNYQRIDKSLDQSNTKAKLPHSDRVLRNGQYARSPDNVPSYAYHKNTYLSDKDVYNSTSTSDQDLFELRNQDDIGICNLCESLRRRCWKHSKLNTKHLSTSNRHNRDRIRTRSVPVPSSSSTEDEPCLLCQKYNKNHYYLDNIDCCCLCEAPHKHPRKNSDYLLQSPAGCGSGLGHLHRLARPPLHRRWSNPHCFSDGEEDSVYTKNIPYEPKTEMVKDLKKKLEDEYLHREYLRKTKNIRRRWRSWDAEDLEELRNFRRHKCDEPWDHIPQHKCVHRYLQNDRLFLEPTLTDSDGSSLCSECGAPQPRDHLKDPYLYHITLGGLRNHKWCDTENVTKRHRETLPDKDENYCTSHPNVKPSKRLPGDTSKHIFARLNRNVNNIFPLSSQYDLRPRLASELRYRVNPHSKRHPSKSMALVDHLL